MEWKLHWLWARCRWGGIWGERGVETKRRVVVVYFQGYGMW